MKLISIDLAWKECTKGRRALCVVDQTGSIRIAQAKDDDELLELASENAEQESIILLDIPIDGCRTLRNIKGKRFRPVDKALAHQGIWIQPSYTAKMRGQQLKHSLESLKTRPKVYEIYPYAVYKFLACLKDKNLLRLLNSDGLNVLLDDGFRSYRPLKYKRDKTKSERLESMRYLYSLLTDPSIGLNFSSSLSYPNELYSLNELSKLSDEYDACLGAIAGIYFTNNMGYACIAGDSNSGNILLLADRWLQTQLKKEVEIRN